MEGVASASKPSPVRGLVTLAQTGSGVDPHRHEGRAEVKGVRGSRRQTVRMGRDGVPERAPGVDAAKVGFEGGIRRLRTGVGLLMGLNVRGWGHQARRPLCDIRLEAGGGAGRKKVAAPEADTE